MVAYQKLGVSKIFRRPRDKLRVFWDHFTTQRKIRHALEYISNIIFQWTSMFGFFLRKRRAARVIQSLDTVSNEGQCKSEIIARKPKQQKDGWVKSIVTYWIYKIYLYKIHKVLPKLYGTIYMSLAVIVKTFRWINRVHNIQNLVQEFDLRKHKYLPATLTALLLGKFLEIHTHFSEAITKKQHFWRVGETSFTPLVGYPTASMLLDFVHSVQCAVSLMPLFSSDYFRKKIFFDQFWSSGKLLSFANEKTIKGSLQKFDWKKRLQLCWSIFTLFDVKTKLLIWTKVSKTSKFVQAMILFFESMQKSTNRYLGIHSSVFERHCSVMKSTVHVTFGPQPLYIWFAQKPLKDDTQVPSNHAYFIRKCDTNARRWASFGSQLAS